MAHQISLRGPWQYEWLSPPPDHQPPSGRCTLPLDWETEWGRVVGIVACHRWFHRPTNLETHETVWVIAEGVRGGRRVCLNGQLLEDLAADQSVVALEVTNRLQRRNQLSIELSVDPVSLAPAGLAGPVRLEIRTGDEANPDQAASAEDSQTAE